jgi:hypothetical protein
MGRADSWESMPQTRQTISRIMVLATMFRERSEANVAYFSIIGEGTVQGKSSSREADSVGQDHSKKCRPCR